MTDASRAPEVASRAGLLRWLAILVSIAAHGAAFAFLLQVQSAPMAPSEEATVEVTLGSIEIDSTSPSEVQPTDLASAAPEEVTTSEPLGVDQPPDITDLTTADLAEALPEQPVEPATAPPPEETIAQPPEETQAIAPPLATEPPPAEALPPPAQDLAAATDAPEPPPATPPDLVPPALPPVETADVPPTDVPPELATAEIAPLDQPTEDLPLTSPNGAEAIAPPPLPIVPAEVPELTSEPQTDLALAEPQVPVLETEELADPDLPPVPKPRPANRELAATPPKAESEPKVEPKPKAEPAPRKAEAPKKETPAKPKAGSKDGSEKKVASKPKTDGKAAAAAQGRYGAMMSSRINGRVSRSMSEKGKVTVAFTVAASGSISNIRVTRGSGSRALDNAAVQAVRSAGPFPPFPADMGMTRWNTDITLNFR